MLTAAEQAERCAAGLHAHWRTQCGYVAGGEVAEHDGLLVTATRLPDETLNVAFAPDAVSDPAAALDWFEGWFRTRGLKPGIEVRVGEQPALEALLAERGYSVVVRRPAMALHPVSLPGVAVPRASVRAVGSDADLAAFQAIQAEVFAMTPEVTEAFLPRAAVETPGVTLLVGSYDGVDCATSAVSVSAYGAGIVGVATLPAYRRRGLGRLVTAAAVHAGAGADLAWLYPSAMARRLYEGLGFRALDETQVWVSP
ncbi:MAG TPA: GNAT family N-acetyltransferase [Frankiaceae bacterium]|nr:GNAT family N-acetyltransferase [Frankiaceae bacterium]